MVAHVLEAAHLLVAPPEHLSVFPDATVRDADGDLRVGGLKLLDLAREFGTPLYVFDLPTLERNASMMREALDGYPGLSLVCYAAKAYAGPWLLNLLAERGLGIDVVSAGELKAALMAGVPTSAIYFHGNNKSDAEIRAGLDVGVGRFVIDSLHEARHLSAIASSTGRVQPALLRVAPGVDAHTHAHLQTGGMHTKFGVPLSDTPAALRVIADMPEIELRGLHMHIGSLIDDAMPYQQAIDRVFEVASACRGTGGFELREFSPGGGYGVRYRSGDPDVDAPGMVRAVGKGVVLAAQRHNMPVPDITIEPGRSIVARAAVALYEVGAIKASPSGRTFVAIDGGMADNIRPTAYGSEYEATIANAVEDRTAEEVAIAGRYCETGDILIQSTVMPLPVTGDILAVPVAGAYQLAMSSNYNMAPRPAVVGVRKGSAFVLRRRETLAHLLQLESAGIKGPPWSPAPG